MNPSSLPSPRLASRWRDLRRDTPGLRPRQVAALLDVSEGELLDGLVGHGVVRLRGPWGDLLARLESVGPLMALTRNDHCVIENDGHYRNVQVSGSSGQVVDEGIDLRVFLSTWGSAYLVPDDGDLGLKAGVQFFDVHGQAVHKAYLRAGSDRGALERIGVDHADPDQEPGLVVDPPEPAPQSTPDEAVDVESLRADWSALQDTHQFHGLLARHGVNRLQALRLGGEAFAWRAPRMAHRTLLQGAAASGMEFMIFVGNRGVLQIHSGPVRTLREVGPWYNVLDERFNLHLDEPGVAEVWVVRKPTAQGAVTALELYDAGGGQIVLFTGKRPYGEAEDPAWRTLVEAAGS